jgi:hypothetical protein
VAGALTVKINEVVLVRDPATEATLTVWFPVGVVESVEMLSVAEQVGLQDVCEKVPVAPDGRPETENAAV